MKFFGQRILVVVFMVSLLFVAGNAGADIITIGAPNADLYPYPAPYAEVSVELVSGTLATITVTGKPFTMPNPGGYSSTYLIGNGSSIALNINGAVNLVTTYNPLSGFGHNSGGFWWNGGLNDGSPNQTAFTPVGSNNVSDFGVFTYIVNNADGFGSAVSSLSFQLENISGTAWTSLFPSLGQNSVLTNNSIGNLVAAHIFVPRADGTSTVSGFAGDGRSGAPVPVPPTVWLLGSGLIGFWGIRRRFFKK